MWKTITVAAIVVTMLGSFVYYAGKMKGYFGGKIDQQPTEFLDKSNLATYVWKDGEIVYSWYDPIDSLLAHPELKKKRRDQARHILKVLK